MRKSILLIFIIVFSTMIFACTNNIEKEEENINMSEKTICGFEDLLKEPKSDKKQDVENIIKIMFFEWYDGQNHNEVAIDIGNKTLYTEPQINFIDIDEPDYSMSNDDVKTLFNIINKNNILNWESNYIENGEYEDGYSWGLFIQYQDGNVNSFIGKGQTKENVVPENFDAFVNEITDFSQSKAKDAH